MEGGRKRGMERTITRTDAENRGKMEKKKVLLFLIFQCETSIGH